MRSTSATAALVLNQIVTMPQSGAPWDFCLLSDIGDKRMPDYKFYVFLNAFRVDDVRRQAIQRKLKRNHATALVYASGCFDAEGESIENMQALTGIRIAMTTARRKSLSTRNRRWRMAWTPRSRSALALTVSPLFYADDSDAQVVGKLVGSGRAGLVVKPMDGWTSIYSAAMTLRPPALMRNLARLA